MKKTPTSSVVPGFRTGGRLAITALSLATLALAHAASAQTTTTWSGGGGDNNWGTGANWGGSPPPVGTTSDLVFAGTTRTNPFNNYTAFDDFRNIFFASGAGTFSITGNAIDLFGKIENNSTNTQAFALDLGVNTSFIEINPVQGNLNINSANIFLNANQLRVWGDNGRTLTFGTGTIISGTTGSVAINQNSTVVYQSAHTYTGDTFINAGVLRFASGSSANNSTIRLGDTTGAANASLQVASGVTLTNGTIEVRSGSSGVKTFGYTNTSGTGTIGRTITLNTGATADVASGGTLQLSGVISGANSLTKNGGGVLNLGAANTFSGGLTLNAGTLRPAVNSTVTAGVVNNGAFGTGTLTINGGAILPGGAGGVSVTQMLVNSNFSVNAGAFNATDNGRLSFAGILNLAGGTRTITLGRWTNALGTLLGGQESWRFFSNNALAATVTNGTVRFARDAAGTASDFVSVNFSGGMALGTNVGITIASNVITTFAGNDPWGTTTVPVVTVEGSGYFNLSTDVNARNARIQSLSGSGIVTSLANAASAQSSTLTVQNASAADNTTFSGRIVEGNLLNAALGTSATNVTIALTKSGAGTLTLSGSNNYSGTTTISAGALQIGAGGTTGSLGTSGAFVNNGTLIFNRSDSIAQGTDFNSAGISGSGTIIKLGAGTLTFNAGNSYTGATDISNGAVRISNATGLGTTAGGVTVRSGAALELIGGISVGSEALTLNGSGISSAGALRNISGDNTYGGAITLGSASRIASDSGLLTLNGTINNGGFGLTVSGAGNVTSSAAISGAGGLDKSGAGTLTLSGGNTFTGKTTISGGAASINADTRLGTAPGAFTSDQLTLSSGGKLITTTGFTFGANRGITLGAGGGVIEVSSGAYTLNPTAQIISGSGSLTKTGAGTLALQAANTFSGGSVISEGWVQLRSSSTLSGSNIVSGALGTGDIAINGGGILGGGGQTLNATNITVNGDFGVNSGISSMNGRVTLGANLIDLTGGTRTVSLGRLATAATTLQGGLESLRLNTNATFYTPVITNGTMRFVRDTTGGTSDFASVNFGVAGIRFAGNSGFTVGTNIITTFAPGNAFTNASGDLPNVTTEDGGIFNLGTTNGVNSQTIRSLAGTAGFVTTLANLASTNTATLTISNQAGDNYNYGGRIVTGSELNATLGTLATNAAIAITKTGAGTQVLSGSNTYGGATTISAGVLTFANTNAKSVNSQVTVQSNAIIGLGVGGAGGYDEATITSIISNTATGYTMNVGSIVGIDTTAGNFDYGANIGNSRELWKLGANTLTLSGGSGRFGATVVTAGTLELNATSGQAAGGTSAITVRSGATLLIAKSDQVNSAAAITLSGGTIAKGSGVSETMGDLSLTAASTLDYGTSTAGTLTFGTYAPSALTKLTLNNFGLANTLRFVGSDLSSFIVGSYSGTTFSNDYFNINGMDFGFTSSWDSGSSTFTITSVPEPSTVLAALGLTGLLGWPVLRRRLRRKA